MACDMCKLVNSCDEMRRHPSITFIKACQSKAAMVLNPAAKVRLCNQHQDPRQNQDIVHIIRHWIEHVCMDVLHRKSPSIQSPPVIRRRKGVYV